MAALALSKELLIFIPALVRVIAGESRRVLSSLPIVNTLKAMLMMALLCQFI